MTSYAPLEKFLAGKAESRLRLTFREIEKVLGAPLPPSARRHQPWWANTDSHSQAKAWLRKGWRTEAVDIPGERISFVKEGVAVDAEPKLASSDKVEIDLSGLTGAGREYVSSMQARFGLSLAEVVPIIIDMAGRRAMVEHFAATSPVTSSNSVDLIREDRDGR